jgi:hypothetical protein
MEVAKQSSGSPKNVDLLERWADADSGRVQPDGTPIKNRDLLERLVQADSGQVKPGATRIKDGDLEGWAQRDNGRVQPDLTRVRISDETEQTRKRPPTRLILALLSAIVCIGGFAKLGSLNRPLEGSTASSEITRSMQTLQSRGNVAAREQTFSEAASADSTTDPSSTLTRPNRSKFDRTQRPSAMSSAEEAKLLARAESLIKQFDFASARLLLAYALEKGSARAAFMMAETFDPQILRSWQLYGVRGDAEKAREFYQLAAEAGIEKAQDEWKRSNRMRTSTRAREEKNPSR